MASPEGVTAGGDIVIISVYNLGSGFGIRAIPNLNSQSGYPSVSGSVGTVYKIGYNVYNVIVGNKVGFKTECFFSTDLGETFAAIDKSNILLTYELPP